MSNATIQARPRVPGISIETPAGLVVSGATVDALVDALRDCLAMLDDCGNGSDVTDWFQRVDAARAALAKVES